MKKILLSALATVILVGSFVGLAASYEVQSFFPLNSTTPLKNAAFYGAQLPMSSTITNGQTNIAYYVYGNNYPQFISPTQPIFAYSTNQVGITSSGTIGGTGYTNVTALASQLFMINPYGYANAGTNAFYLIFTNGVSNTTGGNVLPGFMQGSSVELAADANGLFNPNGGFTFAMNTDGGDVGTVTISLAKSYDKVVWDTNNLQTLSLVLNGTAPVFTNWFPATTSTSGALTTNGITTNTFTTTTNNINWLNGARFVEIYKIQTPTNGAATTNLYLYTAEFSQFKP